MAETGETLRPEIGDSHCGNAPGAAHVRLLGDIMQKLESWERELSRFEAASHDTISDLLRVGIVLRQIEEDSLRTHLLHNAERLKVWTDFKQEVISIRLATRSVGHAVDSIDGLQKGGVRGGKGGKHFPGKVLQVWQDWPQGRRLQVFRQWRRRTWRRRSRGQGPGQGLGQGLSQGRRRRRAF